MAFQRNPLDEDQMNQGKTTQSGVVGGGSNTSGGAAAGTGWTNLNQYLDTNKGAGEQIANAAVQDTGNQFAENKSAIDSWSKGLQDNLQSQKQADTTQAETYKGQASNAGANFGQAAQQQSFDAWKKATEKAPEQFENLQGYQGAYGAQSKIGENLNLIKDPTNQSKIVADTFRKDRPTYSSGMGKLDTFLATADGGNALNSKLQNLAGQYSGDFLGQAKTGYGAGVQDLQQTMGKNREDVVGAISGQYNQLKSQADSGVAGLNSQRLERWNGEQIGKAASYGDVLDQQQLADLEALSQLSGQTFNAGQKNKTFSRGEFLAPPTPKVEEAPVVVEEKPDVNIKYKSNPSGTNYIDSRVDATVNRWKKGIKF